MTGTQVIPTRYGSGMTVQITVRVADDAVRFLDEEAERSATSRAAVLSRILLREARRQRAERDAAIYAADGEDVELAELATWSTLNAGGVWKDLD